MPEPEPDYEYLFIPKEHGVKFSKLVDAALKEDAGHLHTYNLWTLIEEIFPQTRNTGGWSIVWVSHSQPALRRIRPAPAPVAEEVKVKEPGAEPAPPSVLS